MAPRGVNRERDGWGTQHSVSVDYDGSRMLIVMASHGRHGISAIVLGSETVKVLTHCKVPVLVHR
jgi:universal stress protein family protein